MSLNQQHDPKRILVTGGAGFIGTNYLLQAVPAHPEIRFVNLDAVTYAGRPENLGAIAHAPNYGFVQGDIADRSLIEQLFGAHDFDTVLHFAAESHVDRSILDPLAFVRTNVLGTATLLEVARTHWDGRSGVRFHHVSTDEVFGSLGPDGLFTPSTPYAPRSPYAASKAGADHLVRAYHTTYGMPVVLSNASNNYGPYQYPEKLIPLVIRNAVARRPVPVYGKGENVRDWLNVLDHCDAIDRILRFAPAGETYLVGGHEERNNLDLVRLLLDLVDEARGEPQGTSQALITFVTDRPGHDFRYALDGSHLARDLGWKPARDLREGLRETVAWYLANPEWLAAVSGEAYDDYYRAQYAHRQATT